MNTVRTHSKSAYQLNTSNDAENHTKKYSGLILEQRVSKTTAHFITQEENHLLSHGIFRDLTAHCTTRLPETHPGKPLH
jgi:hypothetical protein